MISPIINLHSMSKLHYMPRAEKPGSTASHHRSRQVVAATSRHSDPRRESKRARHEVALDMIWHLLHTHVRIGSHADKERIIQW
jgi:hypothetical protein